MSRADSRVEACPCSRMAYNKSKNVEAAQNLLNQGKVAQAIAEYQNILKYEPRDQVTLMTIGELYIRQGETFQAIDYFERLAQIFVGDGFLTKAIAVYKRIAKLAPEEIRPLEKRADLYVQQGVMSEARSYSSKGNLTKATQLLEQAAGLEKGGEQTELLLDLYLKNSDWDEASALAHRVFEADPKNFGPMQKVVESLLQSGNGQKAMEILEKSRLSMIDAGEHEVVPKLLTELSASIPGRREPLELLLGLYRRTSDSFHIADALAHLGGALVADQQYERAKKTFEQLVDRDPESDSAKRKLN